jgi:uncharacterized membrane protein YphA (DoxX/SURF4 family)
MLFWICGFVDRVFATTYWRRTPHSISNKLTQRHHKTCLWTQLVFSLALCVAGSIRQLQRQEYIGVFEGASIISTVPITVGSFVLVAVSYLPQSRSLHEHRAGHGAPAENDRPLDKKVAFIAAYASIFIFGFIAAVQPFWGSRVERTLRECATFATEKNLGWKAGAISPIRSGDFIGYLAQVVAIVFSLIVSTICWVVLRSKRQTMYRECFPNRILVGIIGLLSIFLIYAMIRQFIDSVFVRDQMGILWEDKNGQNSWTIGQVGALFSWTPLLVDIIYTLAEGGL